MERLKERHQMILKALSSLNIALKKFNVCPVHDENYEIIRDSIIKRFEYTMDTFWKFLKEFLLKQHGIEPAASPSKIFRQCLDTNILTSDEFTHALKIIEDRNLTSHTYNEALAEEISHDVAEHYVLMKKIIEKIEKNIL